MELAASVPGKVEKKLSQEQNYGNKKNDFLRGEGTLIQGGQDPTSTTQKPKDQTEQTEKSL